MRFNSSTIVALIVVMVSSFSCGKDVATKQSLKVSSKVNAWEQKFEIFENFMQLSSSFKQAKTAFDFNGDGNSDYVYFAEVKNTELTIPDSLTVYQVQSGDVHPATFSGALHAIAIVHGGADENIVIHEARPMTKLDAPAALDLSVEKRSYIASIENQGPLHRAKGDIIILPTGAGIDTYIYYDGNRYLLYEPLEIP
ncbi:hypothetical protein [Teredinibacter haidensis]|uniref:hypothetical protein n=1 Tax=Teredinibacter haidensis TaxID=2731755 RepID=UPI000948B020|nr:hypothetical protein [Teredinibacter haidensis]